MPSPLSPPSNPAAAQALRDAAPGNPLACLAAALSYTLHTLRDIVSQGPTTATLVLGEQHLYHETLDAQHTAFYQQLTSYDASQKVTKQLRRYEQGQCCAEAHIVMHPHASVCKPPTMRRASTKPTLVFLDLRGTGAFEFHSTPESIDLHAMPRLELTIPTDHNASWQWAGELVLTCRSDPLAARLELHGSRVQGKVLDANTMRTVALVRGSLAQGVVVEEVQGGEPMQVLPPGGMVSKTISLDALGGLRMPLLWSALHDSLLFAVPTGIPLRPLHLQADDKQGHGHELLPLSIKNERAKGHTPHYESYARIVKTTPATAAQ